MALLQTSQAHQAAEALDSLPFEQQQSLFRRLPLDLAATIVPQFPYYHQYVLLHSRPAGDMKAVVDKIHPDERMRFFDDLPEEAWQQLMDELSSAEAAEPSGKTEPEPAAALQPPQAEKSIIEARQIEKSFTQPDGKEIHIIAPLDLSVESGTICALLGPSGSGKSTLCECCRDSRGHCGHGAVAMASHWIPAVRISALSFSFCPAPPVNGAGECRGSADRATAGAPGPARPQALEALAMVGLKGFENAYPKELSGVHQAAGRICACPGRKTRSVIYGRAILPRWMYLRRRTFAAN